MGFGQSADIDIVFADSENRKYAECRIDENGKKEKLLLYYDGETISGKVGFKSVEDHNEIYDNLLRN